MAQLDINTYNIDFSVLDTNDPKSFYLLDKSSYIVTPDKPRIFITPPGLTGNIAFDYPGVKNTIIEINSDILGTTDNCDVTGELLDLEDGVWQITMAVCPYEELYTRKCYLRTTKLECRLNDLLIRHDNCGCLDETEFKKTILDIDFLILSAKASASICDEHKATMKYRKANDLVGILEKRLNCK